MPQGEDNDDMRTVVASPLSNAEDPERPAVAPPSATLDLTVNDTARAKRTFNPDTSIFAVCFILLLKLAGIIHTLWSRC